MICLHHPRSAIIEDPASNHVVAVRDNCSQVDPFDQDHLGESWSFVRRACRNKMRDFEIVPNEGRISQNSREQRLALSFARGKRIQICQKRFGRNIEGIVDGFARLKTVLLDREREIVIDARAARSISNPCNVNFE